MGINEKVFVMAPLFTNAKISLKSDYSINKFNNQPSCNVPPVCKNSLPMYP